MDGYIEKKALLHFCDMGLTGNINAHEIEEFPLAEVYTRKEVINILSGLHNFVENTKMSENNKKYVLSYINKCINDL